MTAPSQKSQFWPVTGSDFARSIRWAATQENVVSAKIRKAVGAASGEPPAPARLAADICRCHDGKCTKRSTCMRWVARKTGGPSARHVQSMRDDFHCAFYLPNTQAERP